ncbi:MAG: hypothetical protein AAGA54_35595 [Myxococcota bacterium]
MRLHVLLLAVSLGACRDGGDSAGEAAGSDVEPVDDGDDDGGSSSSTGDPIEEDGSDVCLNARVTSPGVFRGDLEGKGSNGGGACGAGGPDVFFRLGLEQRVDVSVRATGVGFEPRVGVWGNDCAARFSEAGLLCTAGTLGWVLDVDPAVDLFIAVGGSADAIEASEGGAFELEISTRPVLEAGERCGDPLPGRCEGGTTCAGDPLDLTAPRRCVVVPGDRCSTAIDVQVDAGRTELTLDPATTEHSDQHAHACGGARLPERVYRLQLPEISETTQLHIEAEGVVALAARGPTCLPEEERACTDAAEPSVRLEPPPARTLYLFAELPEPPEPPESGDRPEGEVAPALLRLDFTP